MSDYKDWLIGVLITHGDKLIKGKADIVQNRKEDGFFYKAISYNHITYEHETHFAYDDASDGFAMAFGLSPVKREGQPVSYLVHSGFLLTNQARKYIGRKNEQSV